MDGLHLSYIVKELSRLLTGARVDRVLMPEKDELHIIVRGTTGTHRLLLSASASNPRAHLTQVAKQNPQEPPMFCMLLRKLLVGARVQAVRQMHGDRIMEIDFAAISELGEPALRILSCEIMGRHSNIILRDESGRILDAIHHVSLFMSRVREVRPGLAYMPPPPQDKLNPSELELSAAQQRLSTAPARLDKAIAEVLSGVSMTSAREIAYRLTGDASPHLDVEARVALAAPLCALLPELLALDTPVLLMQDGQALDAFPFVMQHMDPGAQKPVAEGQSAALDAFYLLRDKRERMGQKSQSLVRSLRTHIERAESKLAIHQDILAADARIEDLRVQGELLTAALHAVSRGQEQAIVPDYYAGGTRSIALDIRLSPAQNAQRYYKQYQKMRAAQKHAAEQTELIEKQLAFLTEQMADVRKCETAAELDEIRMALVREGFLRASHSRKQKKVPPSKPLSCTSSDGIALLIGKNSAQNERITQGAQPEHTWLHAKDMPGSHVIIQHVGEVPERTLREAAMLAAWFSNGYQSAQVPVDYTKRRYVRKPSGAAAGYVTYTHQHTLYMKPDEVAVRALLGDVL